MRWRAWYTGDRLFAGVGLEEWAALPPVGMLAVEPIQEPPYRRIIWGADWYYMMPDGEIRDVRTHPEWGRWSPPPRFVSREMVKRAGKLPDDEWRRFADRISARVA